MRTILMTKARQLKAHPDICHVHFEHGRPLVSEALTRL
jgi:hypothetical protein